MAEAVGFHWARKSGSHNTFRNQEGRIVVIPDHGSRDLVRPLVRKIIRDMALSVEDYHRLLDDM
ncbi:MAG: type II toxin-antitoxin system HicA family toxin [Chloroflexi bacterium]|nr:type II toxin-antitoxin system HicA family toxin [Chloroflexota bacterium]